MTAAAKAEKLNTAAKYLRLAISWLQEVSDTDGGATAEAFELSRLERLAASVLHASDTFAIEADLEEVA